MISASYENEDAFLLAILEELHAIRQFKLTRAARRHTVQVTGIALEQAALSQFVQVSGPALEGRNFVHVGEIAEQPVRIHRNISSGLHQRGRTRVAPISSFPR